MKHKYSLMFTINNSSVFLLTLLQSLNVIVITHLCFHMFTSHRFMRSKCCRVVKPCASSDLKEIYALSGLGRLSLPPQACMSSVPLFGGLCAESSFWAPSCVSCPETDQAVRDHSCQRVQQPGHGLTQFSAVSSPIQI